ncbi:hypothetical protein [Peribacillus muralis]|uniref:hypothetical protein n=1 Tax=Peribacillus muralis TaxID=264697 RepID=UPI00367054DF
MYTYEEAVTYFEEEVLHNTQWVDADESTRKRALKNAENELYITFKRYKVDKNPLPKEAIFEQTLWLLRKDDTILRAEQGVTNVNLSGAIQMSLSGSSPKISPNVVRILGRKRGRYA